MAKVIFSCVSSLPTRQTTRLIYIQIVIASCFSMSACRIPPSMPPKRLVNVHACLHIRHALVIRFLQPW